MHTNSIVGIDFDSKTNLFFAYIWIGPIKMDINAGEIDRIDAERVLEAYLENKQKKNL